MMERKGIEVQKVRPYALQLGGIAFGIGGVLLSLLAVRGVLDGMIFPILFIALGLFFGYLGYRRALREEVAD